MNKSPFCSIEKYNFGKKNRYARLIFVLLFCLLGSYGSISDWKAGISAAVILCFAYLLRNTIKVFVVYLITVLLLLPAVFSFLLDVEWINIFAITLCMIPAIFLKSLWNDTKKTSVFEVFYLDQNVLKCLVMDQSAYKGYTLTPESYIRTYNIKEILSFIFKDSRLYIVTISYEKINPLELTISEVAKIHDYVQNFHPQLINREDVYEQSNKATKLFDLHRLLIMLPLIISGLIIYFFGDNGRNTMITFVCITITIITYVVLFKFVRHKGN